MRIEWITAIRFLREGRAQTLLVLSGVTVGVGVIIFLTALISGLQTDLISKTLGSQAHIVVRPQEDETKRILQDTQQPIAAIVERRAQRLRSIEQWQKIEKQLQREPGVIAVSPMVAGPGFAVRGNADMSIAILGVDPQLYTRIVDINSKLRQGEFRISSNDTVIGIELAHNLGVRVGDKLRIETQMGASETLTVAGIFDIGVKDLNKRWAFVNLRVAQSLLDLGGGITNFDLAVDDIFKADTVADNIANNTGLIADSWMKINAQLMIGLRSQSASSNMIQFFVIVAVAFGIASVLVVSVVQKSREIGILRAMGTRRIAIVKIFLIQGGIVGVLGSIFGSALGAGLALVFANFAQGPNGQPVFPVDINALLFVKATLLATTTGLLSATIPAMRAAKLDPVTAIRYG